MAHYSEMNAIVSPKVQTLYSSFILRHMNAISSVSRKKYEIISCVLPRFGCGSASTLTKAMFCPLLTNTIFIHSVFEQSQAANPNECCLLINWHNKDERLKPFRSSRISYGVKSCVGVKKERFGRNFEFYRFHPPSPQSLL